MRNVSRKKFEDIHKHYSIYRNDKFLIAKKHPKGFSKNYLIDLCEPFVTLLTGILGIILFPIHLIRTLVSFIPRIILVDDSIEDVKKHPKGQYHFDN